MFEYVCIYVCIYTYICIYIHTPIKYEHMYYKTFEKWKL